jgi:hypothetical protein
MIDDDDDDDCGRVVLEICVDGCGGDGKWEMKRGVRGEVDWKEKTVLRQVPRGLDL